MKSLLSIIALLLLLPTFAYAVPPSAGLGLSPTEFIRNFNIAILALTKDDSATIQIAEYKVGENSNDTMLMSVANSGIGLYLLSDGQIEKIQVANVSIKTNNDITALSSLIGFVMLAVNKGYGAEDLAAFMGKVRQAISSKRKSTEFVYKGKTYGIIVAGDTVFCFVLNK